MREDPLPKDRGTDEGTAHGLRRKDGEAPLRAALIASGREGRRRLQALDAIPVEALSMRVLGIADPDPEGICLEYARDRGLFAADGLPELYGLEGLELIIDLTGSEEAWERLLRTKPPGVSLMDRRGAGLLWNLIQGVPEKKDTKRDGRTYEEHRRRHTQIILDSLPYRIMVVNMDMTVDTVNRTFLKEFNLTPEDVQGKYCHQVRYGLHRPCGGSGDVCYLRDSLEDIKRKGIFSTIKESRDAQGQPRFDVITLAPIYDPEGEVVQILEASRDVTDRIRLEREVEKSNLFLQNVIRSTVDGIVVVDTQGNVLIFNEGMERLTGYSAREVKHLTSFYPIVTAKENMRKMRSDAYGPPGKLNPTSMTVTTKTGEEIPVTLSASIVTIDGEERGSVGVFTDMREILKMRKDLEEAHLQLVRSERIASVGRMAAGVAHEINNPLSGILIYAELLKEALEGHDQHLSDVQEIIEQTLRCKNIVSELLEFSRQSVGKVTSFSFEELVNKTLNILINQALFQDIRVRKEIAADLPEMVGDLGQLQQVLTNLFMNAAEAMEGKGSLEIRARYDRGHNQFVIKVSDSGPGIPKEIQDKIFDIFFTTKPVGKGTGLGLSISMNIIELHGGSLTVTCPPKRGTTFTIELPLGFVAKPTQEPLFLGLDEDV